MMNLADLQKSLPPDLLRAVSGYAWRQNNAGCSASKIFRLFAKDKEPLYLKIDSRALPSALRQEKLKLEWLEGRLPVPKVLLFTENESSEYLLLSEIPGAAASQDALKTNIARTVEELTNGLKIIHRLPVEDCPFDVRLARRIEAAKERMAKKLVDEDDFDEERLGRTPEDLFEELNATEPPTEDLVFTHGDYCAPNVILVKSNLSGFVDWAGAGIADRFQDLALLSRSVRYNFGEEWEKRVFEIYGVEPDWEKIGFYRLLDEFF